MATAKRRRLIAEVPPVPVLPPGWGEYRCYHRNEFGRPCNKLLGHGRGEFEVVCSRCGRKTSFTVSHDPLTR